MSALGITAAHESWQEPGAEEQWSDSFYFGGGDGRGLAFYSRIGRRPNEGVTEGALGIWLPGQGFLLTFARTGGRATTAIAAGPVAFELRRAAGRCGRSRFDGAGRLFERAEHIATDRDAYRTVDGRRRPAVHRLGRAAVVRLRPRGRGRQPTTTSSPARSPGAIVVDGRRHALAGRGMRDHSWGVRDWQGVP